MPIDRTVASHLALVTVGLLAAAPALAAAQSHYPNHAIKIVVPSPPGPTLDVLPRIIAARLSARWGQPVIIENKPGAAQNLGAELVAKAEPDGYTLLASPPGPLVISQYYYRKLRFDPTAFAPISIFASQPLLMVVNPKVPAKTFQEFISYARANPGKLSYGSAGTGSTLHLTGEMLEIDAGIRLVHVPYPGLAPVLIDLIAGRVDMGFIAGGNVLANNRDGKLRILAITGKSRIPELPDIPTIAETFPGFESSSWFALMAPPRTRPEITAMISQAIADALREPEVAKKFRSLSVTPLSTSPAETARILKAEAARWHTVIATAGIKEK